jgi:hypothetical protein
VYNKENWQEGFWGLHAMQTRARVLGVAFAAAITATVPAALHADWMVTRQGERFEIRGTWQLKGKLAVFTLPDGTFSSMRADQVDFEASKQATEQAKQQAAAPPPAPEKAKPQRRAAVILTDKDFQKALPPSSAPGTAGSHGANIPVTAPAIGRKGMTWQLDSTNPTTRTIDVGCGVGNNPPCNAYEGDTACTERLPILCIQKEGAGFPLPLPAGVNDTDRYHRWSGGVVRTTEATVPPTTRAAAHALCVKQFGPGWRVAEFHDGWGWHFQAHGSVDDPNRRFWVDINDQAGATCWQ